MAEEKKKERGKWFREMKSELKKVVWPDGKTTMKNTATVLTLFPSPEGASAATVQFSTTMPQP